MLPVELTFENRKIYVTPETRDAFVEMARSAALDGVTLLVDSGYRSPAYQRKIYQRKMEEGDDFYAIAHGVAPPGYSEHMLGTTLDLVPSKWTFNNTSADKWLQENGARFSFSQSYPEKTELGFAWEPWHWKYIGGS
jgi:D-alanyl-D-alanine carboxypeptidase